MKSWPNVKLGQIGVRWNVSQNPPFGLQEVISGKLLAPIHMEIW